MAGRDRQVQLIQPRVYLNGEILTDKSFWARAAPWYSSADPGGKARAPSELGRPTGIALLGRGRRLPWVIRNGRLFVAPAALAEALPALKVCWQEHQQELHLFWTGESSAEEPPLQEPPGQVSQVLLQ